MVVAFGGAESPEGDSLYAYPARESLWSPNGVAKIMQGAKPVRLAAGAFDNMVLSRLAASRSFTKGIHLYASRRGVLFCEEK